MRKIEERGFSEEANRIFFDAINEGVPEDVRENLPTADFIAGKVKFVLGLEPTESDEYAERTYYAPYIKAFLADEEGDAKNDLGVPFVEWGEFELEEFYPVEKETKEAISAAIYSYIYGCEELEDAVCAPGTYW